MKIVVDTNIWISYLINNKEQLMIEQLRKKKLALFVSEDFIDELKSTASRKKFEKYFTAIRLAEAIHRILLMAVHVEIIEQVSQFKDAGDDFLLDLCYASQANVLVTGDKALLKLGRFKNTQMISLKDFKGLLEE